MDYLLWILYFTLAWDSTYETNHHVLNIGIIHYSTAHAGLTKATMEPLLLSLISENDLRSFRITWGTVNTSSQLDAMNTANRVLQSDIHVLISALRCPQFTPVSAMTEALRIPHLALDIDTCRSSRNETYTLHLVNRFYYLSNMVADIVVKEGWKKLILVTDTKNDMGQTSRFVKKLSKVGVETVLEDISPAEIQERTKPNNFLVMTNNISLMHRLINNTKFAHLHKWIFITDLDLSHSFQAANFIWVRMKYRTFLRGHSSFRESLTYPEGQLIDIVRAIVSQSRCASPHHYNQFNESCAKEKPAYLAWVKGLLENITQACGAEQKLNGHVMCNTVEYEIYGLSGDGLLRNQSMGVWNPKHGLILNQYRESLFRVNSIDFNGIELLVAIHNSAPYSTPSPNSRGYEGMAIDIMEDLSKMLNFKYNLVEPKDKQYGRRLEDGSWTGLVGMAHRREVDVAAGSISVTLERSSVVDYVTPFLQDGLGILAPQPVKKADMFQAFKSFSMDVWFLVLVFGLTTSLGLILVQYLLGPDANCPDLKENWAQESVFLVVSSFLEQGLSWEPYRGSARCLLGFWFIFTILTIAMYTANLVAVLTVSNPIQPINSLEDLAARTDMGVVIVYGAAWDIIQESTMPLHQTIASRAIPTEWELALKRVLSGKMAWISDTSYLRYRNAQACGAARVGDESFQSISQGFIVPKNSPYKNGFDISVQKMVESGTIKRLENKWLLQRGNCTSRVIEETFGSLDFSRLGGVFIVFGASVFTAIVSVLLEQFISKRLSDTYKKDIHK